ncbi:MAG: YegP family protein [Solirubrobacteraceae bacterium]
MATATKNSGAASNVRSSSSMKFLIFEDNGGAYHWRIVASDGAAMAQSAAFPSYEEAGRAVELVRGGAASARFDKRADELLAS